MWLPIESCDLLLVREKVRVLGAVANQVRNLLPVEVFNEVISL